MSKQQVDQKLADVKLRLAEKCVRLAKAAGSVPKRKTYEYQAARFRRQAADLARK